MRAPLRAPAAAAVLLSSLLLSACASGGGQAAPEAAPTSSPTRSCTPAPLERRAAAVLLVGLPGVTSATDPLVAEVMALGVGGIFLAGENVEDAEQLSALVDGLRAAAPGPIAVSTDEESGRVAVARDVVGAGPSPRRLAATRTPEQVRAFAARLGGKLADVGVDLDLAPVFDIDDGPAGGVIGDRSFSADPRRASDYALAFARGLAAGGVRSTAKHFPGQGRSPVDTHASAAVVDTPLEDLRATDLAPFQDAIDAGIPAVMVNHLSYTALDPALPASLAPPVYALLRDMGFQGVAMTDSLGMGAVSSRFDFPEAAVRAVAAGADLALVKDGRRIREVRDAVVAAVRSGRLPEERLDEAAARVTALAGGDPMAIACRDVAVPQLSAGSTAAPTTGTVRPTATATTGTARPTATPTTGTARPTATPTR